MMATTKTSSIDYLAILLNDIAIHFLSKSWFVINIMYLRTGKIKVKLKTRNNKKYSFRSQNNSSDLNKLNESLNKISFCLINRGDVTPKT